MWLPPHYQNHIAATLVREQPSKLLRFPDNGVVLLGKPLIFINSQIRGRAFNVSIRALQLESWRINISALPTSYDVTVQIHMLQLSTVLPSHTMVVHMLTDKGEIVAIMDKKDFS